MPKFFPVVSKFGWLSQPFFFKHRLSTWLEGWSNSNGHWRSLLGLDDPWTEIRENFQEFELFFSKEPGRNKFQVSWGRFFFLVININSWHFGYRPLSNFKM